MALRGTLGDFGIADIFQLVGHQSKTGVLRLKNRSTLISIYFVEGSVVKTDQKNRPKEDRLGNMMVRAQLISETQLDEALEEQERQTQRLGTTLVVLRYCTKEDVHEFTRLQTTETIYKLFTWEEGTYEFTQEEFEYDSDSYLPLRTDNVLMEGFRILDEYPGVRSVIPHLDLRFVVLKSPEPLDDDGDDFDLDAAFGMGGSQKKKDDISENARIVFGLVEPDLDARTIADRSRMGEFETRRALAELVKQGYLSIDVEKDIARRSERSIQHRLRKVALRMLAFGVLIAAIAGVVRVLTLSDSAIFAQGRSELVAPGAVTRSLANLQKARLRRFVARHRLLKGAYPDSLSDLSSSTKDIEREASFPYRGQYAYENKAGDAATGTPPSFSIGRPLR